MLRLNISLCLLTFFYNPPMTRENQVRIRSAQAIRSSTTLVLELDCRTEEVLSFGGPLTCTSELIRPFWNQNRTQLMAFDYRSDVLRLIHTLTRCRVSMWSRSCRGSRWGRWWVKGVWEVFVPCQDETVAAFILDHSYEGR